MSSGGETVRIVIVCPDWEVLSRKCIELAEQLAREGVSVELVRDVTVELTRFLQVRDGLVQLPQVVVLKQDSLTLVLTRRELEQLSVDSVLARIREALALARA